MDILDRCPGYIFVIFSVIRSRAVCTVSAYRMNAALVFGAFTHEKELFSVIPRNPRIIFIQFGMFCGDKMCAVLFTHGTNADSSPICKVHLLYRYLIFIISCQAICIETTACNVNIRGRNSSTSTCVISNDRCTADCDSSIIPYCNTSACLSSVSSNSAAVHVKYRIPIIHINTAAIGIPI